MLAKSRQNRFAILQVYSQHLASFFAILVQHSQMSMFFGGESFQEFVRKRAKPARFSNVLEFRNDYVLNFRKIISRRFSKIIS